MKIDLDNYKIFLYDNELKRLPNAISKVYKGTRLFVLTDTIVHNLYNETLTETLKNYNLTYLIIDDKSINSYIKTTKELINNGIKRDDLIVSFGGGTVGDVAGFIAATLFRGIDYIQIPTTLLAQVDSSIGGKTAVDLEEGKNLIGAFYNPKFVFIDTFFLKTLDEREHANGFAEAIKVAITLDEQFYNKLRNVSELEIADIKRAVELKRSVVIKDPFDNGERLVLNFGHTYGHAIEKVTNYTKYKHGEAISYGMLMALELGVEKGITQQYLYDDLEVVLLRMNLIKRPILNKDLFKDAIKNDKKNNNKGINFVLIEDIGKTIIVNLSSDEL